MRYTVSAMLAVVAVIHLLPLSGVLGAGRLAALYGLPFDEPNLAILMRHRAVLFGLLGVFLLGLLTKRTGEPAAMAGMVAGFLLMLYIKFFTPIAWTWYVLIGTSVTFGVGYLLSYVLRNETGNAKQ